MVKENLIKVISTESFFNAVEVFNFEVEEDESYVADGFVVHNCRCSVVPIIAGSDIEISKNVGGEQNTEAELDLRASNNIILSPGQIEQMVKDKRSEAVKVGQYISRGEWDKLSFRQLRELAKRKSISVSRTKEDLLCLLKSKTGLDYSSLVGKDLFSVVQEHGIKRSRDKDELIGLLKASLKREELPDYDSMTVIRLREISKEKGVSLYLTKLELIDVLDTLEPGIDHSKLPVVKLIEARQRFNIPMPRIKDELVRVLERQFKEDLKRRKTK